MDSSQQPNLLPGISYNAVLCWVGNQFQSDPAVRVARGLAALSGGTCTVVLGLDSPLNRTPAGGDARTPLTPEVISRTGSQLAGLYGADAHTIVLPGHPVKEVRRYARNNNVDLVVLGHQALRVQKNYGEKLTPPCSMMILVHPAVQPNHLSENSNAQSSQER